MNREWLACFSEWRKKIAIEVWRFNCFPFYDADPSCLPPRFVGLDVHWMREHRLVYHRMQRWWFQKMSLEEGVVFEFKKPSNRLALLPARVFQQLFIWGAAGYYHDLFLRMISRTQREALFQEIDPEIFTFATKRVSTSVRRRPSPESFFVTEGENLPERLRLTAGRLIGACFAETPEGFRRRLTLKVPEGYPLDFSVSLSSHEHLLLFRYLRGILEHEINPKWKHFFN